MGESRSSTPFGDSQTSQTRLASKWMWTSLRLLGLMKSSYIYICAAFTTRVGQNAKYILVCSYHAFLWKQSRWKVQLINNTASICPKSAIWITGNSNTQKLNSNHLVSVQPALFHQASLAPPCCSSPVVGLGCSCSAPASAEPLWPCPSPPGGVGVRRRGSPLQLGKLHLLCLKCFGRQLNGNLRYLIAFWSPANVNI